MPPRANVGRGNRALMDSHQAGKGDKDRSPGYRKHYDEINWNAAGDDGFKRVTSNRIRKTYGAQRSYPTIAGGDFDHVAAPGAAAQISGADTVPLVPTENASCCEGDCGCHKPD
jgi:hypothetical protein